jgi:hypothetical protein
MTRVTFEGFRMDARTRDMLVAARVVSGPSLTITQGSYNGGGVAASAGTHDGGGALDLRARDHTAAQRRAVVGILRKVGFAAWLRTPSQGNWPYHYHVIAKGCPDLSRGARGQVTDYLAGRNGLANNGADDGTRAWVNWTWEKYKATYPHLLTEDELSAQDVKNIRDDIAALKVYVESRTQAYASFDAKNTQQQLATLLVNFEELVQKYAVAVNEFTRQDGDLSENALLAELGEGFTALRSAIAAVQADVDKLEAAAEAPKG